MKRKTKSQLATILAGCLLLALVFGNPGTVTAATEMVTSYSKSVLSAEEVGSDIYLMDVVTLNQNSSFVGIFADPTQYQYYYGSSDDLVNWNLDSKYFSLIHGNGIFVGLSGGETHRLHYTKDGKEWNEGVLPTGMNPMSVKFENGYFKLISLDEENNKHVHVSKDAATWYDLAGDVPAGAKAVDVITVGGKFYSLVGTSISGDGFKVYSASSVSASATDWKEIDSLSKKGLGMEGNFFFNGKSVGVQLYSIADYEANGYVADKLYYVTDDFINWQEKDWTKSESYYYLWDSTSTDSKNLTPDGQKFEDVEILPYGAGDANYVASWIIHSKDGIAWLRDIVKVYVNGKQVSKEPQGTSALEGLEKHAWAREGAEYVLGRGYLSEWYVTPYEGTISRGDYLTLIMKALNVQEPDKPRDGYVPFDDVWYSPLIERANKLGLTNGIGNNKFAPDNLISRQDMMVLTYNIMSKLGKIDPDTGLTALSAYKDKDKVKDYAKLAVSSMSKAGIIKGDGINVNPTSQVTNAEAVTIAKNINKYRFR